MGHRPVIRIFQPVCPMDQAFVSLLGLVSGPARLFFKPYQLPPSPWVQWTWARAVSFLASNAISTCLFWGVGYGLVAVICLVVMMTLGFSRSFSCSFQFFSFSFADLLRLCASLALRFLPRFHTLFAHTFLCRISFWYSC